MPTLPEAWLKNIIDTQDLREERTRVGADDYTHVSTLVKAVCARQYVLANRYDRRWTNPVTGAHQLLWKNGRVVEEHVRAQAIKGREGLVYGRWECPCQETWRVGMKPIELVCERCRRPAHVYQEFPWRDEEYRIIGNPDLPLLFGRYFVVCEIKSLEDEPFQELKKPGGEPYPDHVLQAAIYQWLIARAGMLVHDEVIVYYGNRKFKWGSPYIEFHANTSSQQQVQSGVQAALETAALIRDGLASTRLPDRWDRCPNENAPAAKKCPVAGLCFNLR